jgi:hypothetical protein
MNVRIVDDEPERDASGVAANLRKQGVDAEAVSPAHLTRAHIDAADLILVDFVLDEWTDERDADWLGEPSSAQFLAGRPADGLALAAIIRSQLGDDRPRGVALLSGELSKVVKNFSPTATEHAAARLHGLEWAFAKKSPAGSRPLDARIISLTKAVGDVKLDEDDVIDNEPELEQLLALPAADWTPVAQRDIFAAQPPLGRYADSTRGLSVLRWLAHRILPYPTFLMDAERLALALGISPETLRTHFDAISSLVASAAYNGALADFLGPRWWAAGVRRIARDLDPHGRGTTARLSDLLSTAIPPLETPTAVLTLDENLVRERAPTARELAVRVRPDDWPPFAETGWMTRDLIADFPELRGIVDPVDRKLLAD